MDVFLHWLISTVAIMVVAFILPGITVEGLFSAFVVAVILGLINTFIRPFLILLTLPITFFSLGFFILIINAVLVMFTAALVPGFYVENFWWALLFGILLFFVHQVFRRHDSPFWIRFGNEKMIKTGGRKRVHATEIDKES